MNLKSLSHWKTALDSEKSPPAYLAIADLIAADIDSGKLQTRDRLPPLRDIAVFLGLNYTTVARAFREAKRRSLIDSRPGLGSYVKGKTQTSRLRSGSDFEMSMNLPPEPEDSTLLDQLTTRSRQVINSDSLYDLFRYQDFGGSQRDREAGAKFLSPLFDTVDPDRVLVCSGIHHVLTVLLTQLCVQQPGSICVPNLVYPGLKAIATQLGLTLVATESDDYGPLIRPLENLCKTESISVIYVNPTMQNPSAQTMNQHRREAIADIALRYNIPIVEDDAYGLLPEQPIKPIAHYAPELSYYTNGLSKCFGAGLRTAYLYAPSKLLAQRCAGSFRALSVMTSPITTALSTEWIMDGTQERMTTAIREESRLRQAIVKKHLSNYSYNAHPDGFHIWLNLPKNLEYEPSVIASYLRSQQISVVSSAGFCTDNNPARALRMCLGGAASRADIEHSIELVADILEHPSHLGSMIG